MNEYLGIFRWIKPRFWQMLRAVVSTGDTFMCPTVVETWEREALYSERIRASSVDYEYPKLADPVFRAVDFDANGLCRLNMVKDMTWSRDGSTLVTVQEDCVVRVYVMPPDLDCKEDGECLTVPLNRIFRTNSILSHSVNPGFDLYDQEAYCNGRNTMVISERQLPIKLLDLIPHEGASSVLNSYHFRDLHNDRYYDSHSLKFIDNGRFLAGSKDRFAVFHMNYTDPVGVLQVSKTIGDHRKFGIISSIEQLKNHAMTTYLGSYLDRFVAIDLVSQTAIAARDLTTQDGVGDGIYQLLEADNNNYLYVLRRRAHNIPILDKRMGYRTVDRLTHWQDTSRELTNQKCFGDMLMNNQGLVVGNQAGEIKCWKDCTIGIGGKPEVLNVIRGNLVGQSVTQEVLNSYSTVHSTIQGPLINHSTIQGPLINHSTAQEPLINNSTAQEPIINDFPTQEPLINHSTIQNPFINHPISSVKVNPAGDNKILAYSQAQRQPSTINKMTRYPNALVIASCVTPHHPT